MKKTILAALAAAALPGVLAAESMLDSNADGMVSLDEVQAVFPEVDGDAFMSADADGDALLSAEELAAAQEAGTIPATES